MTGVRADVGDAEAMARLFARSVHAPMVVDSTQAACIVSASDCGGSGPSIGSVCWPSVSKTKVLNAIAPKEMAKGRCSWNWKVSFPSSKLATAGTSTARSTMVT